MPTLMSCAGDERDQAISRSEGCPGARAYDQVAWHRTSVNAAEEDGAGMAARRLTFVTKDSQLLAAVSTVQLALGLSGMAVAIRRHLALTFRSGTARNPRSDTIRGSWEPQCLRLVPATDGPAFDGMS